MKENKFESGQKKTKSIRCLTETRQMVYACIHSQNGQILQYNTQRSILKKINDNYDDDVDDKSNELFISEAVEKQSH